MSPTLRCAAILAAGAPELVAFMSDEAVAAVPGLPAPQYTLKYYLMYLDKVRERAAALRQGKGPLRVRWALGPVRRGQSSLTKPCTPSAPQEVPLGSGPLRAWSAHCGPGRWAGNCALTCCLTSTPARPLGTRTAALGQELLNKRVLGSPLCFMLRCQGGGLALARQVPEPWVPPSLAVQNIYSFSKRAQTTGPGREPSRFWG